jgi:hypothetical protein
MIVLGLLSSLSGMVGLNQCCNKFSLTGAAACCHIFSGIHYVEREVSLIKVKGFELSQSLKHCPEKAPYV